MYKNRKLKICIIVCFVCILGIFIKNQYACNLLKDATYGMPALINKGKVENLYIGSSMFRQGLDIKTLNDDVEDDNYILAYNGNQPFSEYYQLKYLLDHNVQIQNLYIDMYVYSAWEDPEISDEKIFMEVDLAEKCNLWNMIREYTESPFESWWRIFVNGNNELLITWPLMSPILNSQFENGGTLKETAAASYEVLSETSVILLDGSINPIQQEYMYKLIELANENEINVVFIETPKFETVTLNDTYINAMQEYINILEARQVSYVLSGTLAEHTIADPLAIYEFDCSNADYYMDTIHLSSSGRRTFSEEINSMRLKNM